MRFIEPKAELLHPFEDLEQFKKRLYQQIEFAARQCYQSGDLAGLDTAEKLIASLIKRKHTAMLEHSTMSVLFTVDRGVSHEIVRHRLASYAQESTRYCNYSKGKFNNEITYIDIRDAIGKDKAMKELSDVRKTLIAAEWFNACEDAENHYLRMLELGATPQFARQVLNHSTKTALVMTANITEWRHFFSLRTVGTTGMPHPMMLEATQALFKELVEYMPELFADLVEKE